MGLDRVPWNRKSERASDWTSVGKSSSNHGQKFSRSVRFQHISFRASVKSRAHYFAVSVLS